MSPLTGLIDRLVALPHAVAGVVFSGQNFYQAQSQNNMDDPENALSFTTLKRVNYRKLAFKNYPALCAHCGFGIKDVLEVAHIDCNRANNDASNLVILCPNCHKMHDLDLISTETIKEMRDRPKVVVWSKRMKDAGCKAAASRAKTLQKRKWQMAGIKAAQTRAKNKQLG